MPFMCRLSLSSLLALAECVRARVCHVCASVCVCKLIFSYASNTKKRNSYFTNELGLTMGVGGILINYMIENNENDKESANSMIKALEKALRYDSIDLASVQEYICYTL